MGDEEADVVQLATRVADPDPATALASVAALRRLLERVEAVHVAEARSRGWSWQAIAEELGISRQAVHEKHAPKQRRRRR